MNLRDPLLGSEPVILILQNCMTILGSKCNARLRGWAASHWLDFHYFMDEDVAAFLGDSSPQQKNKKKKKKRKKNKNKTPNKEKHQYTSPKAGAQKQRASEIQKNHVRTATVCLICEKLCMKICMGESGFRISCLIYILKKVSCSAVPIHSLATSCLL